MRVVKEAVAGAVIVGLVIMSLYFMYTGASVKSTRLIPVTVVSEVVE